MTELLGCGWGEEPCRGQTGLRWKVKKPGGVDEVIPLEDGVRRGVDDSMELEDGGSALVRRACLVGQVGDEPGGIAELGDLEVLRQQRAVGQAALGMHGLVGGVGLVAHGRAVRDAGGDRGCTRLKRERGLGLCKRTEELRAERRDEQEQEKTAHTGNPHRLGGICDLAQLAAAGRRSVCLREQRGAQRCDFWPVPVTVSVTAPTSASRRPLPRVRFLVFASKSLSTAP
jgi:hypothetical protein